MTPSLKELAKSYLDGSTSSADFKKKTEELPPAQEAAVKQFTKANEAVQTAEAKYKELGVTVFNSQGVFVGLGSIIEQLHPKFEKMNSAQQTAAASTIFGASAARQMVEVIDAGPAAYDGATSSVEKHGAAEKAAAEQAKTLHGEMKTLGATLTNVGTLIGSVETPIVTAFGAVLLKLIPITEQVMGFIKSHFAQLAEILIGPISALDAGQL